VARAVHGACWIWPPRCYIADMKTKDLPPPHTLVTQDDLADDAVDAWEAENWPEIEAALAKAEASFQRGDYAEFDIEKFLIEVQKRPAKR
jgi:hypothetical protein